MKVLHVAETIKGGVATVMNQLVEAQLNDKYSVRTLTPSDQADQVVQHDNIYLFNRKKRGIFSLLSLWVNFIHQIIKFKPDIVHLHSSFAGLVCRLTLIFIFPLIKLRVIYCPHSFSFLMDSNRFKKNIFIGIERFLSIKTKYIICVSRDEMNQALMSGFNKSKLRLVYNGVREENPTNIEKKTYFNNQKLNLLFVGRFDYQKGYDQIENLVKALTDYEAKYHLTIIGDSVNSKNFKKIVKDNVTYFTWLNKKELTAHYLNSDFIVMPSRWEGLPMVAIEALSLATPIISSNVCSFPEIIDEGVNGFIFDSEINFYERVMFLIDELNESELRKLSSNAYLKYKNNFTADSMITTTNHLYSN